MVSQYNKINLLFYLLQKKKRYCVCQTDPGDPLQFMYTFTQYLYVNCTGYTLFYYHHHNAASTLVYAGRGWKGWRNIPRAHIAHGRRRVQARTILTVCRRRRRQRRRRRPTCSASPGRPGKRSPRGRFIGPFPLH